MVEAIYFLTKILGVQQACEIDYSARAVPAAEALALGLVARVGPNAELESAAFDLAVRIGRGPAFSFGVTKKLFKSMTVLSLETFLDAETWV
jgi:2-(1,2-epoxy-1,2-dihydrophenyl)acetyl-CoA isomerase